MWACRILSLFVFIQKLFKLKCWLCPCLCGTWMLLDIHHQYTSSACGMVPHPSMVHQESPRGHPCDSHLQRLLHLGSHPWHPWPDPLSETDWISDSSRFGDNKVNFLIYTETTCEIREMILFTWPSFADKSLVGGRSVLPLTGRVESWPSPLFPAPPFPQPLSSLSLHFIFYLSSSYEYSFLEERSAGQVHSLNQFLALPSLLSFILVCEFFRGVKCWLIPPFPQPLALL